MAEPTAQVSEEYVSEDLYEGTALGGPLNGMTAQSRFPEGILAVDKAANRCWVYERSGETFQVREEEGREVVPELRFQTADESRYDVQAVTT